MLERCPPTRGRRIVHYSTVLCRALSLLTGLSLVFRDILKHRRGRTTRRLYSTVFWRCFKAYSRFLLHAVLYPFLTCQNALTCIAFCSSAPARSSSGKAANLIIPERRRAVRWFKKGIGSFSSTVIRRRS